VLNTGHTYRAITDTMDVVRTRKEGQTFEYIEKKKIAFTKLVGMTFIRTKGTLAHKTPYFRHYTNFMRDCSTHPKKRYNREPSY
jgi:hypothetical protein